MRRTARRRSSLARASGLVFERCAWYALIVSVICRGRGRCGDRKRDAVKKLGTFDRADGVDTLVRWSNSGCEARYELRCWRVLEVETGLGGVDRLWGRK